MAATRMSELVELTAIPDWDDDGAQPISSTQWECAARLAKVVASEVREAPEVFVSAGADGTIHLRWADTTRRLDAELDGDTFYWFTRSPEGPTNGESDRAGDLVQAVRDLFR